MVRRVGRSRPPSDRSLEPFYLRLGHHIGPSQARGTEPRHAVFLAQTGDFARVLECRSKRLVDKHTLAGLENLLDLLEVYSAVHALKQYRVHALAKLRDGVHEFHAPFVFEFRRELLDTPHAAFDIGTAALVGGHHAGSRHMILVRRIIQYLGECHRVRGIGADDAQSDVGGRDTHGKEQDKNRKGKD